MLKEEKSPVTGIICLHIPCQSLSLPWVSWQCGVDDYWPLLAEYLPSILPLSYKMQIVFKCSAFSMCCVILREGDPIPSSKVVINSKPIVLILPGPLLYGSITHSAFFPSPISKARQDFRLFFSDQQPPAPFNNHAFNTISSSSTFVPKIFLNKYQFSRLSSISPTQKYLHSQWIFWKRKKLL